MSSNKFIQHKRKEERNTLEENFNKPNKKKKVESQPKLNEKLKEEENNNINIIEEKDPNKKTIIPISQYFQIKVKEDWKNMETVDLKKYCESIGIYAESIYKLLCELINTDLDTFYRYYSKYQFTLSIGQRKNIQKLFKKCDNYPLINNNFIKDEIKSMRELFLNICNLILNTKFENKDCLEVLQTQIMNNGVFLNEDIQFRIPVNFGNIELKFNKLIIDIIRFIFDLKMGKLNDLTLDEKKLIITKLGKFKLTEKFFQKAMLFDDEMLFKISDYLINCYYILFEVDNSQRNYDNLRKIITCCMPFELEKAKNFINESKKYFLMEPFEIDGTILDEFIASNLTKDSIIKLSYKLKVIEVKAEDINWNLEPNIFFEQLNSDNFTFCFRFPKLNEINFINLNPNIKNNYQNLFKTILKSKTMEQCMNIDSDASKFNYPFSNDDIIKELEEHTLFVPFPANNFYGYSDKMSFTIFLNSYIDSSKFRSIFIDFDNLLKSQFHEIKHIYRLYMHIKEPTILLKTPEIKRNSLSRNKLLKENNDNLKSLKDNQKHLKDLYDERIIPKNEINSLDYGDILEFALNGDKQEVFFINSSLFCLKEKSWDLSPAEFFKSFFESCKTKKFYFNPSSDNLFINSIKDFFKLEKNVVVVNDTYTGKRASNRSTDISINGEIENSYIIIHKANHCRIKK